MANRKNKKGDPRDDTTKRLDCIIRLLAEFLKVTNDKQFTVVLLLAFLIQQA